MTAIQPDERHVGPDPATPIARRRLVMAGHHQHRSPRRRRVLLEQAHQLVAIHHRHLEIGDHHRRQLAQRDHRPLRTILGNQHLEAGGLEAAHQKRATERAVVDDENPTRHA